jgi:hypothetical protein
MKIRKPFGNFDIDGPNTVTIFVLNLLFFAALVAGAVLLVLKAIGR